MMQRIDSPKIVAIAAAIFVGAVSPVAGAAQPTPLPATAEEMEELYLARQDSARLLFSPADVEFVSSMIHHHAQAITMAEMAPTHTANPTVRTLAARIINSQRDEIATMARWLSERGQPVPEIAPSDGGVGGSGVDSAADHAGHAAGAADHAAHMAAGMGAAENAAMGSPTDSVRPDLSGGSSTDGHAHDAGMPGMLTPEQLAALDGARGDEYDRLFLAMMIFHHRGAIAMVDDRLAAANAIRDPVLFKLASDIHAEQMIEIERMNGILTEMTGSPLGPGLIDIR